jgi:Transposase and inactivated derivatives
MLLSERNHLELISEALRPQILEHAALLKSMVSDMEKQIKLLIDAHSDLKDMDQLIQSIPGLGLISSATILAELPEISTLGRKQLAALVGLAPFNRDSGQYRGQRHIYGGRAIVRKVLYCALRSCLRFNPVVRQWFDHFISLGNPYKVAAIACCRKILGVIRAMLISNTLWEPEMHLKT